MTRCTSISASDFRG